MDIFISLPAQTLELFDDRGLLLRRYPVSTAKKGAGEQSGSNMTPRGRHLIRAKIGAGRPENTVFVRRRPTGEVWSRELAAQCPERDWILTRILWLSGRELGRNRLGAVDTMRRYIYLHGCPDTAEMGVPGSIGCVRMRNSDIAALFDLIPPYTTVNIGDYRVADGLWTDLGDAARCVRQAVFIDEQGVAEDDEWDAFDARAEHALAIDATGKPIGTGRLLSGGRIGRLAVLPEWRGKGVGTGLLRRLLEMSRRAGLSQVHLHARVQTAPFYARFGFASDGETFLETGLPHVMMRRTLPTGSDSVPG